jgi:cysteine desulfurase / selenocysteine lyase
VSDASSAGRAIDILQARADTPGCTNVAHLNNAGAALPPRLVTDTVVTHLEREAAIGGYEAAAERADDVEAVYGDVARLINAAPDEIALVESATRAWTTAFTALEFQPNDRILTHRVEYASNFLPMLQAASRDGVRIEIVPDDTDGAIDVEALAAMLDERVRVVALTHVPSQNGLVNPAAAVGAVTKPTSALYFLDACQSIGQLPIDVERLGCDVLTATGRKYLRAPRGTGFLHVRRDVVQSMEPLAPDLRGAEWTGAREYKVREDARRFEQWERSIAGVLGLGAAVRYATHVGIGPIAARVRALGEELRARLNGIGGVTIRDQGSDRCGIVTFTVDGHEPEAVVERLRAARVNTWVISASTAQLDFGARSLDSVVRASVHYYNVSEELDVAAATIAEIARS